MKNSFAYLNGLIWFSSIMTLIVLCFFSYEIYQVYFTHEEVENQFFCGVSDVPHSDNATDGKQLFLMNCASCHNKNMKMDMTGPALSGVEGRWADYPKEDLYNWIRNSQAMINEGHPRAVEVWDEWQPTFMNAFPNLTDEDIEAILEYINVMNYSYEESEPEVIGCSF